MEDQQPIFERLAPDHDIDAFRCGKEALDKYVRHRARRDQSSGIAGVYVLAAGRRVIGHYTLHQHGIDAREMPERLKKRLSKYASYPATLIGRMAVDLRYQKQGFGRDVFVEALRHALEASTQGPASVGVVVEALDAEAQGFYEKYGVLMLNPEKRRLFLPMKSVSQLVAAAGRGGAPRR